MDVGIQTLGKLNHVSFNYVEKNTTFSVSQVYHLKFKKHVLHQSHLHLSLIRKVKIKNVCSYYTHMSHVAGHFWFYLGNWIYVG